jgi:hypothetical protein
MWIIVFEGDGVVTLQLRRDAVAYIGRFYDA